MALKLNETSEIWGSSESDYKMSVFWALMSPDQLINLMMEQQGRLKRLCTCTSVHDIAYQET
jgi:hypothetical protein